MEINISLAINKQPIILNGLNCQVISTLKFGKDLKCRNCTERECSNCKIDKQYFNKKEILTSLENLKLKFFISQEFTTKSNLTIGISNPSIDECSLTFHGTYGFPYISGNGLKGILAKYYKANDLDTNLIFGDESNCGEIIFFNSYPTNFKIIKDILTPHFPKYYNDGQSVIDFQRGTITPPGDNQKITPIPFYCVSPNSKFIISLGLKNNSNLTEVDLKTIYNNLIIALNQHGIGSKTSRGYGRLIPII